MSISDRIRRWLGIADLPSLTMYKAMELKQASRHEELMGAILRLNAAIQATHISDRPIFAPPTMDWDTAQAIALLELQRNPEKEH